VLKLRPMTESRAAVERDVVDAPVPDRSVHHTVARESKDSTDDGAGEDIVPVVVLVDGEGTANKTGAEDGGVDGDELPEGRVVVGEDLEFGVEVEVQEDEAGECGGCVATGHGLEGVVDLGLVTGADLGTEVDLLETIA